MSRGGSKSLGRGSMAHNRSKLAVSGYQALVVVKEGMLMDKKTSVYEEEYKRSPISEQNNVQKVSGHQVWRIVVISQTSNTWIITLTLFYGNQLTFMKTWSSNSEPNNIWYIEMCSHSYKRRQNIYISTSISQSWHKIYQNWLCFQNVPSQA